jgi:subtilisin family serine protease
MADAVNMNVASVAQIKLLLGLNDDEATALAAVRPFATAAALANAVPERYRSRLSGLDLPTLDINAIAPDALAQVGVPRSVCDEIAKRRPFHVMAELLNVPGMTPAIYDSISQVSRTPALFYVDKLSGQEVRLSPNLNKMLVRFRDSEVGSARRKLRALGASGRGLSRTGAYELIEAPEIETGASLLAAAKAIPGVAEVLPGIKDDTGALRFADLTKIAIQFKPGIQPAARDALLAQLGLTLVESHRTPGSITANCEAAGKRPDALYAAIRALNERDDVQFAEPAFIGVDDLESGGAVRVDGGEVAPGVVMTLPWHLTMLAARGAWTVTRGTPDVLIAVIDTGVDDTHPALAGALLAPEGDEDWDFDTDAGRPIDTDGHGTFIAGLLVGNGTDGVIGICPGCKFLPLKVPLLGSSRDYARRRDAILYALQYAGDRRLIVNLSWKTQGDIGLIRDAVNQAQNAGACVVASAGNWPSEPNEPHFPSDYPWVISVGSVGTDGRRSPFSFYGDQVDVAAPGGDGDGGDGDIRSAALGQGTRTDFGTSFASPLVAGVLALQLASQGAASAAEARGALEATAHPIGSDDLGKGLVDATAAVDGAANPAQPAAPGEAGPAAPALLNALNVMSLDDLIRIFGFPTLTARLIIVKRPIFAVEAIRTILGMSDELYQAALAYNQ